MWAGADPRSSGPTLDDDDESDESEYLTALTAATYSENFQILKLLKPDAKRDDVDMLLANAARSGHAVVRRRYQDGGTKGSRQATGREISTVGSSSSCVQIQPRRDL